MGGGERNLVFYSDDSRIAGQDHEWVQDALTLMVAVLRRMGIDANLENTKVMVYTSGFIRGKWGETAFGATHPRLIPLPKS